MSDNPRGKETICRIVIQQCTKATLRFDTEDSPVEIRHGMVVFTCFLQGAQESHLDAIGNETLIVTLSLVRNNGN